MSDLKAYFLVIAVFSIGLWGCKKNTSYSEIPEIHFKKLVMKVYHEDDLGNLLKEAKVTFSFADGDGDLGIIPNTNSKTSQIHYSWMKKQADGQYIPHIFSSGSTSDTISIPYDEVMNKDEAYNKLLQGTIDMKITIPYVGVADMDTVRLDFFITDRANHSSNVEMSPDFSVLADSVRLE
ncbi:MAG: hypothetical protein LBN37_06155 [Bacteroidales bacterium]|jgi:hypothetical protein|nr:hypothetical protein [Bacteroidales bacterium]